MEQKRSCQPERVSVIGVGISAVTMESALECVHDNLELFRGGYICASNVHTTAMARESEYYRRVQMESVMSLPDGKPLAVIGNGKTRCPMEKVTGNHFMQRIFSDARFAGRTHFFYGTDDKTLAKVILQVQKQYPQVVICGWEPSIFRDLTKEEEDSLVNKICQAKADFVWIAVSDQHDCILRNVPHITVCKE